MIPSILVRGLLHRAKLKMVESELLRLAPSGQRISIVLDSPGGHPASTLDFLENIRGLDMNSRIDVKIYRAYSLAAIVALSLGHYREMKQGSRIEFHKGGLSLEVSDVQPGGKIREDILAGMNRYASVLSDTLERAGLTDPKLLGQLHGSGWLKIKAEDCLRLGVVQDLF